MRKSIAVLLITLLALGLMFYTGSRTVHLVQTTLPTEAHVLGYLALTALDGRIVIWCLMFLYGARGNWQRGIALLMVLVDFVGVVVTMAADTLIQSAKNGAVTGISQEVSNGAVWFVVIVIALNIAGVIFTHLTDPNHLKMQAEEEARSKIEAAALRQISANADTLAARLAPHLGEDWVEDMTAQYLARRQKGTSLPPAKKPRGLPEPKERKARTTATPLTATPQVAPVYDLETEEVEQRGVGDWLGAFLGRTAKAENETAPGYTDADEDEEVVEEVDVQTELQARLERLEALLAAKGQPDFLSEAAAPPVDSNGLKINSYQTRKPPQAEEE